MSSNAMKFFQFWHIILVSIFGYNMLQIWFISFIVWHSNSMARFRHLTSLFNLFDGCLWPLWRTYISRSVMLSVEIRLRCPMEGFNTFLSSSLQVATLWIDFVVLLWSSIFIPRLSNSVAGNEIFNRNWTILATDQWHLTDKEVIAGKGTYALNVSHWHYVCCRTLYVLKPRTFTENWVFMGSVWWERTDCY